MGNSRIILRLMLIVLFVPVLFLISKDAEARRQARLDNRSLDGSAQRLRNAIEHSVRESEGDLSWQHLHLVIGFSTGHFAKDPLAARAAREIATLLVSRSLVPGDRLSIFAWEMGLWSEPHAPTEPLLITSDLLQTGNLGELWPRTPRAGSLGGHDTEKAIVQICERLGPSDDAVIVLLANTASSISTRLEKVIGENAEAYTRLFSFWRRAPATTESGASISLPFTVIHPNGTIQQRTLDAVIIVPRAFAGQRLSEERPAYEIMDSATKDTARQERRNAWKLILGLVIAICLAPLVPLFLRSISSALSATGQAVLEVNESRFDVRSVPEGSEICHLAGDGYESANDRTVFVRSDIEVPPARLARFIRRKGNRVEVEGERFRLHSVDGKGFMGAFVLEPGRQHRLVFRGEYAPSPAHPCIQVRIDVTAILHTNARVPGG